MGERSHYEVLGVTAMATIDEVRAAYRRAARDHHPDAGGDGRHMSDLNAAWHVLSDPLRRAAYDRQLARRPAAGHGQMPATSPFASGDEDGLWDADGGVFRTAEEWADLADGRPLRPTRPLDGWWAILPPATLLAAIGTFLGAFVFTAPGLLALAGGMFVLSLGLFVLAPLRAMSRKDPG
jgi:curved DNA-binding protein CbpA